MLRTLFLALMCTWTLPVWALPLRPPEQRILTVEPISWEKDSPTDRDYLKLEKAWGERQLLKPAQERWKDKAWAASATTLVEAALELKTSGSVIAHPLGPLAEGFRQLLKEGADDPLVLTLAAQAFYAERHNWRDSRELLERVLRMPNLPTAVEAMALSTQIPQLMKQGADYRYVRGRLVEVLMKAINDGSYDAEAAAVLVRHQIAALDIVEVTMPSYLTRWQDTVDKSSWPDWVKLTLRGYGDVELAWLERSSDWAAEVKDEQWDGFAKHLQQAREHLVKAWEANPERPEAAALMITVTMGDCHDPAELRLWFDRSIKAQFDYQPAYNNLIWAYRPRWHGSHELMLAFGRACLATHRFDTGVPTQMFCAAMDVADEENNAFEVFQGEGVREPALEMAKGYHEVQGLPAQLQHLRRSNAALVAWLARDPLLASLALKEAGTLHHCTREFMQEMLLNEPRLRGEVAAGSGAFGPEVQKLALLPRTTESSVRAAMLKSLAERDLSADARAYVQEAQETMGFLEQLKAGDWIKLTPRKHLTSFIQTQGSWSVDEEGNLVATGDDCTWSALALDLPFDHDVEMRCEIAFENPEKAELSPKGCSFGTLLRWAPSVVGDSEDGVRFMAFMDQGGGNTIAQAFRTKAGQGTPEVPIVLKPWNSFVTRIADETLHYEVNDTVVAEDYPLEELGLSGNSGRIGFVSQRLPFGAQLKIRNIQVRKFVKADPPAGAQATGTAPTSVGAESRPSTDAKPPKTSQKTSSKTKAVPSTPPAEVSKFRWDYLVFGASLLIWAAVHFLTKNRRTQD